jgi:very-short-patch-repair endonuclease
MTEKQLADIIKQGHCSITGEQALKANIKQSHPQTKKIKISALQFSVFYKTLEALGIEKPVYEYRFHKTRKWRFDFCFVEAKLALEIEGGVWTNGRHVRGSGFIKDMEKYNQAAILGFRLLRVTPEQTQNGEALILIEEYFKQRKADRF